MKTVVHDLLKEKMEKTIRVLKDELHSIRAGRANPALLDHVVVDYYGTPTPIHQIANISVPEARMLVVQPYDPSAMGDIEKAILTSDLGINPSNDGKIIRLVLPVLTEERRKDLVKVVKKIGETSKVALRNERREANDILKKMEKDKEITEDNLKSAEEEVQKMTDHYSGVVDHLIQQKEVEILEV
ncbi:MAG: ribosome recycling factor [delta proteobacterium ML8_F1]|nr:MAG: ribosome recycling factor [delta proteobacterium ML8_F1]